MVDGVCSDSIQRTLSKWQPAAFGFKVKSAADRPFPPSVHTSVHSHWTWVDQNLNAIKKVRKYRQLTTQLMGQSRSPEVDGILSFISQPDPIRTFSLRMWMFRSANNTFRETENLVQCQTQIPSRAIHQQKHQDNNSTSLCACSQGLLSHTYKIEYCPN